MPKLLKYDDDYRKKFIEEVQRRRAAGETLFKILADKDHAYSTFRNWSGKVRKDRSVKSADAGVSGMTTQALIDELSLRGCACVIAIAENGLDIVRTKIRGSKAELELLKFYMDMRTDSLNGGGKSNGMESKS